MDFYTAQMILKQTFDSAFSKKLGTKQGRIDMAKMCCRRVPTGRDSASVLAWAVDYCANWAPAA